MSNIFLKTMMDAQKNMVDSWQNMYKNTVEKNDNPFAKGMQDFFDMQKNIMNSMLGKNQEDMTQIFTNYFKNPSFDPKMFENFLDMQSKFVESYMKYVPKMEDLTKQSPFSDFQKFATDTQQNINAYFQQLKEVYNPFEMRRVFGLESNNLLEKMMEANGYYFNIYKFWKDLEENNKIPGVENLKEYVSALSKKYDVVFKDMVLPMLPKEFQIFATRPTELFETFMEKSNNFFMPWMSNFPVMRDLFMEGILTDKTKLAELLEVWKEQYDKTFATLLRTPGFGQNKDLIEQQNKAVETYIEMLLLSSDFMTRIYSVQQDNIDDMLEKYLKLVEEGTQPKTFNEFYAYWSHELENVFDAYFSTPEYAKILGNLSSVAMNYKIEMQNLIEKYLEDTPIVTKSEVKSLYKTVYELKKEVKALKKQLEK